MLRTGAQIAGGHERFLIAGEHLVAGDLLADEAIVRLAGVEGLHHVVAVAPGVRPVEVQLEAVGVGIAHHVEPLGAPALTVMRAGEQPVDHLFVRVGRLVLQERIHIGGRRRQAGEIEGDPPDQAAAIERVGRFESCFCRRPWRMNASIGLRTQASRVEGTGGRTTFWKAQYLPRAPMKVSSAVCAQRTPNAPRTSGRCK